MEIKFYGKLKAVIFVISVLMMIDFECQRSFVMPSADVLL